MKKLIAGLAVAATLFTGFGGTGFAKEINFNNNGNHYGQIKKAQGEKTNAELIQEFLVSNGIEYSEFQKSEYGYKYKVPKYNRYDMDIVMAYVEKNINHTGDVGIVAWWTYGGYWVEIQVVESGVR